MEKSLGPPTQYTKYFPGNELPSSSQNQNTEKRSQGAASSSLHHLRLDCGTAEAPAASAGQRHRAWQPPRQARTVAAPPRPLAQSRAPPQALCQAGLLLWRRAPGRSGGVATGRWRRPRRW
jgi:hypothetical protein